MDLPLALSGLHRPGQPTPRPALPTPAPLWPCLRQVWLEEGPLDPELEAWLLHPSWPTGLRSQGLGWGPLASLSPPVPPSQGPCPEPVGAPGAWDRSPGAGGFLGRATTPSMLVRGHLHLPGKSCLCSIACHSPAHLETAGVSWGSGWRPELFTWAGPPSQSSQGCRSVWGVWSPQPPLPWGPRGPRGCSVHVWLLSQSWRRQTLRA